jgi:guanine deaminase
MIAKLSKGLRGFLIDAPESGRLRGVRDGAVWIEDGVIAAVGPFDEVRRAPGAERICWQHSPEAVIVPGLIDLRASLPHYPVVARPAESLASWRTRRVFPAEREFNAATARELAPLFFEELARNGTTCAMVGAAIYEESCEAAFEAAEKSGLRAILGKAMADDDDDLPSEKDLALSLAQSERLCRKWHGRAGGRLEYAFSPRGTVACTEELLSEAALIARKFDAFLQTSLSEHPDDLAAAGRKIPHYPGDAAVYARCGALGDRSVLGHGVHLGDDDIRLLAESRSVVAHCPTANLFLGGGIAPLDCLLAAGVRVGLGSDAGAGPELDLWRVMRGAIESQKARAFFQSGTRVPEPAEMFHLATLGGARALGKESRIGTLDLGKDADLVVLDLAHALPYGARGNIHSDLSAEDVIALLVYRGGPRTVVETFVRGTSVYRAPAPLLF